jgi:hypothetical protein
MIRDFFQDVTTKTTDPFARTLSQVEHEEAKTDPFAKRPRVCRCCGELMEGRECRYCGKVR